jgi:hypothetical protein
MQEKKLLNEYDSTKKMLNTLRRFNGILTENEIGAEQPQQTQQQPGQMGTQNAVSTKEQESDFVIINDVEVKMLSTDSLDMKLSEDQKSSISNLIDNFKQQVNQIVDFEPGMSINENQIRLDGSLPDQDINFVLISGQDAGVYINAEMLKLETEVGNLLEKLVKFQATFETSMNPLIQTRNNN